MQICENDGSQAYTAWSNVCQESDELYDRPIVGRLALNLAHFSKDSRSFLENLNVVLHEVTHLLGFRSDSFSKFVKESGVRYTQAELFVNVIKSGVEWTQIKLSKVVETAKNYFGCSSLTGVDLENEGGSSTVNSHWETTFMNQDIMAPTIAHLNGLSQITVALLDSTGWYIADYNFAQIITYGKNKGCEFTDSFCKASSNRFPEFCGRNCKCPCLDKKCCTPEEEFCSWDFRSGIECNRQLYSCCHIAYQISCTDPKYSHNGLDITLELIQPGSSCSWNNFASLANPEWRDKVGRCYAAKCVIDNLNNKMIEYTVSTGDKFTCSVIEQNAWKAVTVSAGGNIYYGLFKCPNVQTFCDGIDNRCKKDCSNLGICKIDKDCYYPPPVKELTGHPCEPEKYLLEGTTDQCVPCNDDGYAKKGLDDGSGVCVKCDAPCEKCDSNKKCYKCPANYFIDRDGNCVTDCSPGLPNIVVDGTGPCLYCSDYCLTCASDTACAKCWPRYFINENGKCAACGPSSCYACSDSTSCDKCDDGLYLSPDKKHCLPCTGPGEYKIGSSDGTGTCKVCTPYCNVCKNENTCQKCLFGYFLQDEDGTCGDCSGLGMYADYQNSICSKCSDYCSLCLSATKCWACDTGYYKNFDGKCVKCDLPGQVISLFNCIDCGSHCRECATENTCRYCDGGYELVNGQCQKISSCSIPNCKLCNDAETECNLCKQGYFHFNDNKECIGCWQQGLWTEGPWDGTGTCYKCTAENCQTCASETTCQKCIEGYEMDLATGLCKKGCSKGTHIVTNADGTKTCVPCPENCEVCDTAAGYCDKCKSYYWRMITDAYTATCTKCDGDGMLKEGNWIGYSQCSTCMDNCKKCSSKTTCDQCADGFYRYKDNTCGLCTEQGLTKVLRNGVWFCEKACPDECKTCDIVTKYCYSCEPNFFLHEGKCTPNCPAEAFFKDTANWKCENCVSNCKTCSNKDKCEVCYDPYILEQTLKTCEKCDTPGFWKVGDSCIKCSDNCLQCNSNKNCQKCKANFYLTYENGYQICTECTEANMWKSGASDGNGTCGSCGANCGECEGVSSCKTCAQNFYKDPWGRCVSCLDAGWYQTTAGECKQCSTNCLNCNEAGCTKCAYGFEMTADKKCAAKVCDSVCQSCKSTMPNCKYCKDSNTCQECTDNYFLMADGTCSDCSQQGYIKNWTPPKSCSKCPEKCLACSADGKCTRCDNGWYIYPDTGLCSICCLDGEFKVGGSAGTGTCETCAANCLVCQDQFSCKTCAGGYYKSGYGCTLCPASQTCKDCTISNCKTCDQAGSKCNVCLPGFYITEDQTECTACTSASQFKTGNADGTGVCKTCGKYCAVCQDMTTCKSCDFSHFMHATSKQCVDCNLAGQFKDWTNPWSCHDCAANCQTCASKTSCSACKSGFQFDNSGNCVASNGGSNLMDYKSLAVCGAYCEDCSSSKGGCQKCTAGYYRSAEGHCTKCDQEGNYISGDQCLSCGNGCKKCKDVSACMTCNQDLYLREGLCDKCSGKNQVKAGLSDGNGVCLSCEGCNDCKLVSGVAKCMSCIEPYFNYDGKCGPCATGLFLDSETKTCVKCDQSGQFKNKGICYKCGVSCDQCSGNGCVACKPGFMLNDKGECGHCKSAGEIKFGSQCVTCSENCQDCLSTTACSKCKEGYYNRNGACVLCDKDGEYKHEIDKICHVCVKDCKKCANEKQCLQCKDKLFKLDHGSLCVACPTDGYFKQGKEDGSGTCTRCVSGCSKCKDEFSCEVCNKGLCRYSESNGGNSICVPCEHQGYFKPSTQLTDGTGRVYKCAENCDKCLDGTRCSICKSGFYSVNHGVSCSDCSDEGFYINSNKQCVACSSQCKKCSDYNTCQECKDGFMVASNGQCSSCGVGKCKKCSSYGQCTECSDGYFLKGGKCVHCSAPNCKTCSENGQSCVQCEKGFSAIDGKCQECNVDNCDQCNVPNKCAACKEGFQPTDIVSTNPFGCVIANKKRNDSSCKNTKNSACVCYSNCKSCKEGSYFNSDSQTCIECPDNCKSCLNSHKCSTCEEGYYVAEFGRAKMCVKCHEGCKTCDGLKCQECQKGLTLNPDKTVCFNCRLENCKECAYPDICKTCVHKSFILKDGQCVCPAGLVAIEKECLKLDQALLQEIKVSQNYAIGAVIGFLAVFILAAIACNSLDIKEKKKVYEAVIPQSTGTVLETDVQLEPRSESSSTSDRFWSVWPAAGIVNASSKAYRLQKLSLLAITIAFDFLFLAVLHNNVSIGDAHVNSNSILIRYAFATIALSWVINYFAGGFAQNFRKDGRIGNLFAFYIISFIVVLKMGVAFKNIIAGMWLESLLIAVFIDLVIIDFVWALLCQATMKNYENLHKILALRGFLEA